MKALTQKIAYINFKDNRLLTQLFGEDDCNLTLIEQKFEVVITSRGNNLSIAGDSENVQLAKQFLQKLYHQLEKGFCLTDHDIGISANLSKLNDDNKTTKSDSSTLLIKTPKKHILPFTTTQASYLELLENKVIVFASGPAGTGKTYLAIAVAVSMLLNKKIERLILSRPAVEAGEKLGFLPGDLKEKIDPYLRPLYDALQDMIAANHLAQFLSNGEIEIAPLAFMRGRTLSNAFIILDEAQNTTATQMKMFLTRLGRNSKIVVTGDPSQVDLPGSVPSGFADACEILQSIDEVGFVNFSESDIIRHPLTHKIIRAYNMKTQSKEQKTKKD